jgi:hypothetical protein
VNASVIRRRAEGDPVYRALLTQAEDLEQAALEVERDSATAGQDGL